MHIDLHMLTKRYVCAAALEHQQYCYIIVTVNLKSQADAVKNVALQ
jgi:hypothetical protein